MNSSTIATLVNNLNFAAICASVLLAVCGVLVIFGKKTGKDIFSGKTFFRVFCIASIAALAAEFTFFNFQYYLRFFAGPEVHTTTPSPDNPNIIQTSDGVHAETFGTGAEASNVFGITFKNLDRKVTSVFTNVVFNDNETVWMTIQWTDEEGTRQYSKKIYKYLPYDDYSLLQPLGKVSELTITFSGYSGSVELNSVVINKPIPFYFSGLRLFVMSFLFFAAIILLRKKLRSKISYYLFEYKFNPANRKQTIIYASTVALLILFSWICVYTTPYHGWYYLSGTTSQQYNKYLVDAIIEGRTWLDYGTPENLLGAKRPYDQGWLVRNGYNSGTDFVGDWSWYNGKFYSYYGIVPAVILYVPYKLITGNYLSHLAAVFLFSSISVCLLALLWRFCVIKYMPNARFAFYLLSFLALFFANTLFVHLRYPSVYTTVQTAGFMFAVAGVLLLLKSVNEEKIHRLKLFLACLCFALVVGCRPTMIFASLLVPIVLWRYRSWKLLLFIMVPYVMVAILLCIYNYVRFESIFEFGQSYCIGILNHSAYKLLNPIGTVIRMFVPLTQYLFLPNVYSLHFPYVTYLSENPGVILGFFQYSQPGCGIINFPIVFCLFYLARNIFRKDRFKMYNMSLAFLIVGLTMAFVCSFLNGYHARYMLDFAVFIILPSLFCAYFWCNDRDSVHQPKTRMKVTYTLLAATVFVGLFLFVTGMGMPSISSYDPVLYRYLEYSLSILRNV